VNRKYRLTCSSDIQRVRRSGKSFAHPLLVLIVEYSNEDAPFKAAFLASKSLGIAVSRNRAKRVLRAAFSRSIERIIPGVNVLVIARAGLINSPFTEIEGALQQVLNRARIINNNDPAN